MPQVKVTSYILNWKFILQEPADQSAGQRIGESHLAGKYLDIALVSRQYLDIWVLLWLQYYISYCPPMAFDLPTQWSVT